VKGIPLGAPVGCRLRLQNLIQNCGGYLILHIGLLALALALLYLLFALLCLFFGLIILLLLPLNFLQAGLLESILDLLSL
jgi:hypothetical protein